MDGAWTIWTGSAISRLCEDNRNGIVILHTRFDIHLNNPTICDNGTMVGKGVRVENNSFTSQLIVTVSPDSSILGDTIVCAHSHNGTTYVIGNTTVELQNLMGKFYGLIFTSVVMCCKILT